MLLLVPLEISKCPRIVVTITHPATLPVLTWLSLHGCPCRWYNGAISVTPSSPHLKTVVFAHISLGFWRKHSSLPVMGNPFDILLPGLACAFFYLDLNLHGWRIKVFVPCCRIGRTPPCVSGGWTRWTQWKLGVDLLKWWKVKKTNTRNMNCTTKTSILKVSCWRRLVL